MRIAIITGASSGLGTAFAEQIDLTEEHIDEIWLIARRQDRLEAVAQQLRHATRVIPMDLTRDESIEELEGMLREVPYAHVGVFINCAGYGKIGNYEKVSRYDSAHMIDLNCKAAVNLTLTVLPYMRAMDRILQICSTAAFQPIQHLNIYAASKAFLYNYTRALRMELLPRGIIVTAVCPWWIRDTEFISIARDNDQNEDSLADIRHFLLPQKEERVVKRALRESRWGFAVSTPGIMCFLHRFFCSILPRKFMLYFWELFRKI